MIIYMILAMNVSATFKEMFELDEFPLDYQALNIWLISEWPFTQVHLVKDDEYMDHLSVNTFTGLTIYTLSSGYFWNKRGQFI